MNRFWKEYYIVYKNSNWTILLKNNWHEFQRDEWHLLSVFRKWHNRNYYYCFCVLGLQFRILDYRHRNFNK